ncbi:MAG: glycosyltransferase family 2 protein, partial [Bacilli bacterium]|nr:glycosyltransferase family 2 protein [Bacilli bacterium]
MEKNYKVSILVPVYNTEKFLNKCLDSLIYQTLKDIEIILVNDGSSDLSPVILDNYKNKDSRIKVITLEKNEGLARA